MDRVIASKVQSDKYWHRPGRFRWQVDQDVHLWPILAASKIYRDLLSNCFSVECLLIHGCGFELHLRRPAGTTPVDLGFEQFEKLRSTPLDPSFGVSYRIAIRHCEYIRQGIRRHLILVVIRFTLLGDSRWGKD